PKDVSLKEVYLEKPEKSPVLQKTEQTKTSEKVQDASQKKDTRLIQDEAYMLSIKGYIFGDKSLLEPALLELVIKLEESGFIYGVDIVGKDMKTLKGKGVMEFELKGRCAIHEV
ncbi:MAG TPA: hypothetical protein PK800_06205, partial [Syntrophorhabdaceae bacterium]|nr:hypothetical protein [Syntrophorhabdaceae bacterium]